MERLSKVDHYYADGRYGDGSTVEISREWYELVKEKLAAYEDAEEQGRLVELPQTDIEIDGMSADEAIRRIADHCRIHFLSEYPHAQHITLAMNIAIKALANQAAAALKGEEGK